MAACADGRSARYLRHESAFRLAGSSGGSCLLEDIAGRLHGLLIRLDDRLPGKDVTLIAEFIDAGELGLALEQMADVLSEDEQPLAPDERAEMLDLVERMQMGDRVPGFLRFCPEK